LLADVAVLNTAKVRDLKAAVMKYIDSMEQIQMGHRHISWYFFLLIPFCLGCFPCMLACLYRDTAQSWTEIRSLLIFASLLCCSLNWVYSWSLLVSYASFMKC
jgi:hypothetical protein